MADQLSEANLEPCPFCGGPAKEPFAYNGAMETTCAGPHECPGTDVLAPLAAWNTRAPIPITDEMVEAGAHAAWRAYFMRDGDNPFEVSDWRDETEVMQDTWPAETNLYPNADVFRRCARACLKAALSLAPKPTDPA